MMLKELVEQITNRRGKAPRITAGAGRKRVLKMTAAERVVYAQLKDKGAHVAQQVRNLFMLDGGGMYIPDFIVFGPGPARVIEVKGGYRGPGAEQGYERYKRAALQYSGNGAFFFELWTVRSGQVESIDCWEEH